TCTPRSGRSGPGLRWRSRFRGRSRARAKLSSAYTLPPARRRSSLEAGAGEHDDEVAVSLSELLPLGPHEGGRQRAGRLDHVAPPEEVPPAVLDLLLRQRLDEAAALPYRLEHRRSARRGPDADAVGRRHSFRHRDGGGLAALEGPGERRAV